MPTTARPIRSLAACAAIALALAAPPARAHGPDDPARCERAARGALVDVEVLVDGRAAPLYLAPGRYDRRYFEAFQGRDYGLRVRNRTGRRVGVLISVDGLNVVSGERSRLSRDEAMYVLGPWESATIRGWRTSLEEVRRFVFVDERRSYAARTGQANGDMGWIRVLAFEERHPHVTRPQPVCDLRDGGARREREAGAEAAPAPTSARADEAPLAAAEKSCARAGRAQQSFPGTGWGERQRDRVRRTWFVAAAAPGDRVVLRYEYASGLLALGIRPDGRRLDERERGELGELGFAQPPRW